MKQIEIRVEHEKQSAEDLMKSIVIYSDTFDYC